MVKNQERYLGVEAPPEKWEILAPHQDPQPMVPVLGEKVPTTSALKTNEDCGWMRRREAGVPGILLKWALKRLTSNGDTPSKL